MLLDQILPIFFTFIGLVIVVYVFSFTMYGNILKELSDLLDKYKILSDPAQKLCNKIKKSFYEGRAIMHIAFVWCLSSSLIVISGVKLSLVTAEVQNADIWWILIKLMPFIMFSCIIYEFVYYILKTKNMNYGFSWPVFLCLTLMAFPILVFLRFNCANYLKDCVFLLMAGMVMLLAFWAFSIYTTTPQLSLHKLREILQRL